MATSWQLDCNKRLMQTQSPKDVEKIVTSGGDLNLVNCATALQRLAKLSNPRTTVAHHGFMSLIATAEQLVRENEWRCHPRQLSGILWALAKLGWAKHSATLCDSTLHVLLLRIDHFGPQELSNALWGVAKLKLSPSEEVLEALANAVQYRIAEFIPQGLSNCTWAFANIGYSTPDLLHALCDQLTNVARRCNSQEISNTFWALGKLEATDCAALLRELSRVARQKLSDFTAQHLANVAWGAAKLGDIGSESRQLLDGIAGELKHRAHDLSPQELSMTCWAFATLLVKDSDALDAVAGACISKLADFQPLQLATVSWAFAKVGHQHKPLFKKISKASRRKAADFNAQDLSNAAWGFAKMEMYRRKMMKAFCEAAKPLVIDKDSSTPFLPQHLAMFIWAMAKVGHQDEDLANSIAKAARRHAKDFCPRDITNITWAFETLKIENDKLNKKLARAARSKLSEFNAQELLVFLGALERTGYEDDKLLEAVQAQQELVYHFQSLEGPVTLKSKVSGRKFKGTGVALWEASFVLADWLARHPEPANVDGLEDIVPSTYGRISGKQCVEIGAGIGLVSVVATKLGAHVVTTDGDPDVLELLQQNVNDNCCDVGGAKVTSRRLLWGTDNALDQLNLNEAPELLLAADVVYGNDPSVWKALVQTLRDLSGPHTVCFLAQVQRFREGESQFFGMLDDLFERVLVPMHSLHPDHRKRTCMIYALRLKRKDSEPKRRKLK